MYFFDHPKIMVTMTYVTRPPYLMAVNAKKSIYIIIKKQDLAGQLSQVCVTIFDFMDLLNCQINLFKA